MRGKLTTLLACIIVFWVVGVALLGDTVIVGAVLTVPGFCALGLAGYQARKECYEAVAPWACCALVLLSFLGILSLANFHLHDFTGAGPGWNCDAMAQNCDPQPLQGLLHAGSLLSFIAAGIATLVLIRYSARFADDQPVPITRGI